MKHFSMTLLLSLLLMIPTILTLAEREAITVETSIQDELVSIDDFISNLDGEIEELEANHTYVYTLDEQIITIDLTTGYSLVNDQSEPYLLIPSELDESILNIMWFLPQQIEEEIFVPIQFIERVLNTTYDAEKEEFILNEPIDLEEEEIVLPSNPVEIPFIPVEDEEIVEETPVATPPIPSPPKQETPKPSTPTPPKQENPTPPVEEPEIPTPPIEEPEIPIPPIEEPEIPDVEEPTLPDNGETVPPEPETPEQPDNPTPPVEEQPETPGETPGI